jgi:hypothetical protein
MLSHRDEFLAADTDAKLYYALIKLTCARWDGHLNRIRLVPDGIQPFTAQSQRGNTAPIKFKPDYRLSICMSQFRRNNLHKNSVESNSDATKRRG